MMVCEKIHRNRKFLLLCYFWQKNAIFASDKIMPLFFLYTCKKNVWAKKQFFRISFYVEWKRTLRKKYLKFRIRTPVLTFILLFFGKKS